MGAQLAPGGPRSLIYRDLAVRALLDELLMRPLTIDAIRDDVHKKLGAARTPSRTAIGRYVRLARLARGVDFRRIE